MGRCSRTVVAVSSGLRSRVSKMRSLLVLGRPQLDPNGRPPKTEWHFR